MHDDDSPPESCPEPEPIARPVPRTDGAQFTLLVEAASRQNAALQRRDPDIDVGELPDIFVVRAGGEPEEGQPFRLAVPDVGMVVVDEEHMTLAAEGEASREALEQRPELELRVAVHATRVTQKYPWVFAAPHADRELGPREREFLGWLVQRVIEEHMAGAIACVGTDEGATDPPPLE